MSRPTNINSLRDAARRRKRKSLTENILVALIAVPVVVVAVAVIFALAGLVTLGAWNIGVVGAAAALGAKVATINLWTAIWVNVVMGVIANPFRAKAATVNNVNNQA